MNSRNYYIKEGYQPNLIQETYDQDDNDIFWNDERKKNASILQYQYYVYDTCKKLINKHRFNKVLDVGCGLPLKIKKMFDLRSIELTLIDQPSTEKIVQSIIPNIEFIGLNLEHIDVKLKRNYDIIICSDVVEHLVEPDKCLSFIRNHLSDNGLAVFSTPERDFCRGVNCNSCTKKEHVREWNSNEFSKYLSSQGFKIKKHLLFPQIKLNHIEYSISRLLKKMSLRPKWYSCQVVICSK